MTHRVLTIDLDDISRDLTSNITVLLRFSSLALQGAEEGEIHDDAILPGTWFCFQSGPLDEAARTKLRTSTEQWILLNALRTLVLFVEVALSKAWHYSDLFALNQEGPITRAQAEKHDREVKSFSELFFFKKLNKLRADFGDEILPPLTHAIVTFRTVRNVLEHQYGVASTDIEVEWEAFDLSHTGLDGTETVLAPEPGRWGALPEGGVVIEGGTVSQRLVKRKRVFHAGAAIALTTQDLTEMCVTTSRWGLELAGAVRAYANAHARSPSPDETAPPAAPPPVA